MKIRILCLLFALTMLFLTACQDSSTPSATDGGETESVEKTEPITIVENQKSDYVILAGAEDAYAKTFASVLQASIYSTCKVFLPIRNLESNMQKTTKKIIIGSDKISEVIDLKTRTTKNNFSVSVAENCLIFYANDPTGFYRMEQYVDQTLLSNASSTKLEATIGNYVSDSVTESLDFRKDASTVYHLIYDKENTDYRMFAKMIALQIEKECNIKIEVNTDEKKYQNEIILGKVDRDVSIKLSKYLYEGDYVAGVFGDTYVIYADSVLGMSFGAFSLIDQITEASNTNIATLSISQNLFDNVTKMPNDKAYADGVAKANLLMGTYSSYQDKQMAAAGVEIRKDHALVTALVERMGGSLAVLVGSSSALHNGYVVKLDRKDYSKATKLIDNHVWVPSDYVSEYFGKTLAANADGYVDLTAYCEQTSGYSLFYHSSLKLAIVVPSDVKSFSPPSTEVNGYSNLDYIVRMVEFFNNEKMPEPNNNVEQTRSVVEDLPDEQDAKYYYNYDYNNSYEGTHTLYSPAIFTRQENGKTVIYAAYEYVIRGEDGSVYVILKRSADDGKTWEQVAKVADMHFASLTEVNGKLYLIGNTISGGNRFFIAQYDPTTKKCITADMETLTGGGAPNSVLIANGRIYKAFNDTVASASVSSDLLNKSSWSFSNNPKELATKELYKNKTGISVSWHEKFIEEGNVVQAPNGDLYVMYRINAGSSYGYVALLSLTADGSTVSLESKSGGIVKFPYTQSKFSLVYDESLGKYISLTSLSTMGYVHQRNVLGLVVSEDLINWEVVDVLLVDRQMLNEYYSMWGHAFQYVDFVLEGDDLYFLVREAAGDSYFYHEGNYITMYKIDDYVEFVNSRI